MLNAGEFRDRQRAIAGVDLHPPAGDGARQRSG
jgi:hypothetical protein